MNRHWYFLALTFIGAAGQMSFVLAGGRFVPSMMAIVARPEPERRLAAAGGRSDGLSPRQIAPAGIAFISSIGILGGAVFPAVFGYLKSRTGTQYRETT